MSARKPARWSIRKFSFGWLVRDMDVVARNEADDEGSLYAICYYPTGAEAHAAFARGAQ